MTDLAKRLVEKMEAEVFATICGPARRQGKKALMLRSGRIVSVELDEDGKPVERCPFCGPVLLCPKHVSN